MSIRARILVAYLAMLAIPLGLIVGLDHVLRSYHEGDALRFLAILRPPTPFARVARDMSTATRRINLQMLEDPDSFASPSFMRTLDPPVEDLGFVVRRGADIVYTSPALQATRLPSLPAFAELPQSPRELPPRPPERTLLGQWDFRFSDGAPGSLFLVRRAAARPPRMPDVNVLLVAACVIVLAAGNGLITFAVARSMIRPLASLELAAERISSGDLETPLPPLARRDEMGRVGDAFERMRVGLRDSLAKQRQYEQSRLELIASISHDLRTPVTTIRGYAEGLRDGVAAGPEGRARYLQTIIDRAVTMDRLIEELFLLSTLELEQAPFAFGTLDLRQFLEDSVEELRRVHEGVPIGLDAASPARVRADPSQMRRVVENVVDNAVRHSGRPDTRVEVRLRAGGGRATVEIRDNGRGIPSADLARVFERFYRGDDARSESGSGLGLTIARRIVEAHGGEILAESPEGGGASIVIRLPLETPS
jgi:histidine kinase